MKNFTIAGLVVYALVAFGVSQAQPRQTVGQDMKDAGHDTADASKTVAHKTASGTKKGYHKTVSGTKTVAHKTAEGTETAAHKTASGTKHVVHKIEGKPTTTDPK